MPRPDLLVRVQSQSAAGNSSPRPSRRTVTRRDGVSVELDGRWLTGFCTHDYLGLAQQFGVVNALQDAASREGVGASATAFGCGHHALHEALEAEVAEWLGYPRAILFANGFAANLAVQQALLGEEGDVCVHDTLNHPSLLDATRLAGARLRRYPHKDSEGALRQLRHVPEGAAMLATDAVFGVDGDTAPLRSLAVVARGEQALFYVDDAHGVGVVGEQGRGSVAAAGLGVADVPLLRVSLDKALGCSGSLVLGSAELVDHLCATARPYVHGIALPPALAAAGLEAVRLARRDQWRRDKLAELVAQFRDGARTRGLPLVVSDSPIQPLLCDDARAARELAHALEREGWLLDTSMPSTAPDNRARLRIVLSAAHTQAQVQGLLESLERNRAGLSAGMSAPQTTG